MVAEAVDNLPAALIAKTAEAECLCCFANLPLTRHLAVHSTFSDILPARLPLAGEILSHKQTFLASAGSPVPGSALFIEAVDA
jgi:hypothetical protein